MLNDTELENNVGVHVSDEDCYIQLKVKFFFDYGNIREVSIPVFKCAFKHAPVPILF